MTVPVPLLKACAALGRELTPSHARDLAEALAPYPSRVGAEPAASVVPTAHFGAIARRLLKAWDAYPGVPGSELGPAIGAAAYAHDLARTEPEFELVLSGPTSPHVHARRTDDVLLELIESAQKSLLLVTYSLYMYPELKTALQAAIARDVQITVLAEDPLDNTQFQGTPAMALAGLALARLRWLSDQRPSGWTSLHAKIAVADDHTVFLTSANLSLKASGDNFEAGVLIHGGEWASRISEHISALKAHDVLRLA